MPVITAIVIILLSASNVFGCNPDAQLKGRWVIHSKKPAEKWEEALLTGNGKQGTMVWGNTGIERITFVYEELFLPSWPRNKDFSLSTSKLLPEVRNLISQQKYREAAHFTCETAYLQQELLGLEEEKTLWGPTPHPAFDLIIERETTE